MEKIFKKMKSFTLIEVLIGVFLILIVFLGIFAAYQLGLKVVGLSERKITATQIAQGELEKIKNLPYQEIGIIGASLPEAKGILERQTKKILNGVEYTIERKVKFVVDAADGNFLDDPCDWDYKKVEIKVSWSGKFSGQVILVTDIAPKDKIEELSSCEEQPGGVLTVQVFDAFGNFLSLPLIEVYNPSTGNLIASASPSDGTYDFPLPASSYKVVVSKANYSTERTYSHEEIAIPEKPNPIVLEGMVTKVSFSIDKLSSFLVKTLTPWGMGLFSDSFLDESKISEKENVTISEGRAVLAGSNEGYLISTEISPSQLIEWQEFSFSEEEPEGTDLKYQVLYASGSEWILIPDAHLPGNSLGFDSSPVNLSNLATTTYSKLKLKAKFSSNSPPLSPLLYDWQISWKSSLPTPIPNCKFELRGEKIIGKDANENPIYKYSTSSITDSLGQIQIPNLEWDVYHFSNFQKDSQSLNLVTSTPPHPISLPPDTNAEVEIYLMSQNSLLVLVQDLETLNPIFSATTTLIGSNYQNIQYTNENGQTIFIPVNEGTFTVLVEAPGYYSTSTTVFVSGQTTKIIKLEPSD